MGRIWALVVFFLLAGDSFAQSRNIDAGPGSGIVFRTDGIKKRGEFQSSGEFCVWNDTITEKICLVVPAMTTDWSLTLPEDEGQAGYVLTTDGNGVTSWEPPAQSSPLTTKGDIYVFGTDNDRLPAGTDNHVLMADAAQTLGIKYAQIIDANIDAAAAIARSKIAAGTANHVVINDGTGNLSSEASLVVSRGGTGLNTWTTGALYLGNGTSAPTALSGSSTGDIVSWNGSTWVASAPASAYPAVFGSRGSPRSIVAGTGLTAASGHMSTTAAVQKIYVEGSGGAVNISANPQIEAGTVDGQTMLICGRNDTNRVQFDDGDGLKLNGSRDLGEDECLNLSWDTVNWVEYAGSN